MAVSDGDDITVVKDMGLVSNVFDDRTLAALHGPPRHRPHPLLHHRLEHVAQRPARLPATPRAGQFALGHNGNLINTEDLADEAGMLPGHRHQRQRPGGRADRAPAAGLDRRDAATAATLERALVEVLPQLEGAFSFVLMDEGHVIGVRDPNGFRPLCLGQLDTGWVLASEIAGARRRRRPLRPRARPRRDGRHRRHRRPLDAAVRRASGSTRSSACSSSSTSPAPTPGSTARACTRPACAWASSWPSRRRSRPTWSWACPSRACPRPRATPARSGIPYGQGLVKNRYIGRTFIAPSQEMRALGVRMKLNPLRDEHRRQAPGRGRRLDRAGHHHPGHGRRCCGRPGATEVHLRISSPPYRWPCFYGMDTGTRGELLAANLTVDEIRTTSASTRWPT